jgi:hypothetical protein
VYNVAQTCTVVRGVAVILTRHFEGPFCVQQVFEFLEGDGILLLARTGHGDVATAAGKATEGDHMKERKSKAESALYVVRADVGFWRPLNQGA